MASALDLDPGSYGGSYKLIGGAIVLDFANLVSFRGSPREHDWLEPAGNIDRWISAVGLDVPAVDDLGELLELREGLVRVFSALAAGLAPPVGDVAVVGERAAAAWTGRRLVFDDVAGCATWSDAGLSLLSVLASDAASLLTSSEALAKLRACGECQWLFLDSSRNRSRQWCDPADCGNRARQRRHYERRRGDR